MNNEKKIFCPVNGWDCIYYWDGECCMLTDSGIHPKHGCSDYTLFDWDDEDDE